MVNTKATTKISLINGIRINRKGGEITNVDFLFNGDTIVFITAPRLGDNDSLTIADLKIQIEMGIE